MADDNSTPAARSKKSKITPKPHRKTKSITAITNLCHIDPKRREEKNRIAYENMLLDYLDQFSEAEQDIAINFLALAINNVSMIRKEKPDSSEIIQFPIR